MRKTRKVLTIILSFVMCVSVFTTTLHAEGLHPEDEAKNEEVTGDSAEYDESAEEDSVLGVAKDTGDTLTIYAWNEEWMTRFEKYMPGYVKDYNSYDSGRIGNVKVKWKIVPSIDGNYQNVLDYALTSSYEDVDIFLVEDTYSAKYVVPGVAKPLSELGITASDTANQYNYTKQIGSYNGVQYASTWQTCCSGMIYNRQIAKAVLGTDNPSAVQAAVSDWNKFMNVADKMKNAGYKMTPCAETSYRVFYNNTSAPWVSNGKINVDNNLLLWADMSKNMVNKGQTGTAGFWEPYDHFSKNTAFCVFGPAWYFDFCMQYGSGDSIADKGGWALCQGPQAHYWGGTWICVADKSDNLTTAAKVVRSMTLDEKILSNIIDYYGDNVNNKNIISRYAADSTYGNPVLGGQNPYTIFKDVANNINLAPKTIYDDTCYYDFSSAMSSYFKGYVSRDEALDYFFTNVIETYPELKRGSVGAIVPNGIGLNYDSLKLKKGESRTLVATVTPANAEDKTVTFSSSNPSVASVTASGVVKAVAAGSANITARTINGISKTIPVKVIVEPTKVTLNKSSATIYYGDSLSLSATLIPSDVTEKTITWTSSDSAVATVNNGTVKATGKKAGVTIITAKTVNGLTAKCEVTVYADNNSSNKFADIKYGSWQYDAAKAVYDKGYMTGKGDLGSRVLFSPNTDINRSQFVVALYSMAGKPAVSYKQQFSDVASDDWYASAVTWATNNGIVAGNPNGTFGVNGKATREQLALMFYKYAKYKKYDVSIKASTNLNGFTDAAKVDSWALDAMKWAVERGIISGKGNATEGYRLDPTKGATRIECAAMMNKFDEVYKNALKAGTEDIEEPLALPTEEMEEAPVPEEEIEEVMDEEEEIEEEDVIDDDVPTPDDENKEE